jgi:Helix-turn-helix domain
VVRATPSASREDSLTRRGGSRMPVHLTAEQWQLALRLKARGLSLREIGSQVGCSHQGVALIARQRPRRPVRQDRWGPGPGRLTLANREEITLGVHAGESFTVIAARLGKATATVSREVAGRRRPGPVSSLAGPPARPAAGQAAQDPEAGPCPTGRPGQQLAGRMVVAGTDLGPVADPVPRRSHDVGEPRNHLPSPVRAGPRRATPRAAPAACAPGEPSAAPGAGSSTPASSGTW